MKLGGKTVSRMGHAAFKQSNHASNGSGLEQEAIRPEYRGQTDASTVVGARAHTLAELLLK